MLRGIRNASANWLGRIVMAVVMMVLAGSFAIWGINDIFRGYGNTAVAKVGDTEIQAQNFRQAYNDRLQQIERQLGRPVTPEQANALRLQQQVLQEMVAQAALDQRVRQMRLGISNAEIARRITSDPTFRSSNGQFDRAQFEAILRNAGFSEQRFVAEQRNVMLRRQILDSITADVGTPKVWLDAVNQFQNEQRSIAYVSLGPDQAGDIPPPTDEQLSKYFDERKILFRAPEYRKIVVVSVTPAELAKAVEVSDDDVKKFYDENRSRYITPERRHVEQIVFPTLAEAQAASERIKGGMSFAALADERGLKERDMDLGTVAKTALIDPALADAAFSLKEGEVSTPVQGRFGAVIVTVLKIEPEIDKTLADVAPQIRNDIALDRAKTNVQDIHDKVEDERAGGSSLEQAAQSIAPGTIRPATWSLICRKVRAISSALHSPATSASTMTRSTPPAAISGTTSPASRRRATARWPKSKARSKHVGTTTRSPRGSRARPTICSRSSRAARRSTRWRPPTISKSKPQPASSVTRLRPASPRGCWKPSSAPPRTASAMPRATRRRNGSCSASPTSRHRASTPTRPRRSPWRRTFSVN